MAKEKIPAISVIIPMYNTEKYIDECLTSLLNQTFKNFEILVVDDCSTDNSVAIVEKYLKQWDRKERFAILHMSKNSGRPGIARNFGIDAAKGKYIYFLDSDDFLDNTVLEDFFKVAEEFQADVVQAKFSFEYAEVDGKFENTYLNLEKADLVEKPTLESFDIAKRIEDNVSSKYSGVVWNKIFRRKFLIENDIKFPAITVTEDHIFSTVALGCAKNYVRIPFIGYHYRKRPDSATHRKSYIETGLLDMIEGIYFFDSCLQKQKFFVENPTYRYLAVDCFYQIFVPKISKNLFLNWDFEMGKIYDFYCKNIFSANPQKNIPLTSYLFISTNIYKMLAKQQSEEIERLKKLLVDAQKNTEAGE